MEKEEYILNLPLKQLALRKIAIVLWNQVDNLPLIKSFHCPSLDMDDAICGWQRSVEDVVKLKASKLLLPNFLKEDLMHLIKPIGHEILLWGIHFATVTSEPFSLSVVDQLRWTSVGTVDYRKTAETLIKQRKVTLRNSYILACMNCLDHYIQIIWEELSETDRWLFYDEASRGDILQSKLVMFWTLFINKEVAKLDGLINGNAYLRKRTFYQYAFECACECGNKVAAEYFFQKLSNKERQASLSDATLFALHCFSDYCLKCDYPKGKCCDVFCYLLSNMEKEHQVQVWEKDQYRSFRCFLQWPWQDLLMKLLKVTWDIIPMDTYYLFMLTLIRNFTMVGYNYPKLFAELFLNAPDHHRNYMIDEHQRGDRWFNDLINTNNTDLIKSVLRNVDDEHRQKIIMCGSGLYLCMSLIEKGKWFILEPFVSESRLSSTGKTVLKETFMTHIARFYEADYIERKRQKWETFFQLIDNANVNDDNKRIVEDAEKEELEIDRPKRKRRRTKY